MATNREICNAALRKLGVIEMDVDATDAELVVALAGLQRLLDGWQNKEILRWTTSTESIAATINADHPMGERALDVWTCRLKRNGIETPMEPMSRDEYDELPQKASTGLPTTYYFERSATAATLYVWPVLAAVNGETLEVTYIAPMPTLTIDGDAPFPREWENAVVYNLASDLKEDFPSSRNVESKAVMYLDEALAFDRPHSVRLAGHID